MSRITSNLPIKGLTVANVDPPKKQLPALQARHGVLGYVAACHAGGRGFYSISSSLHTKKIFFRSDSYLLIFNAYL